MRISDWSSDVCSSDLTPLPGQARRRHRTLVMPNALFFPAAGLAPSFKSRIAERIAASRDPLARLRAGRGLELYYEVGDPHSQLCAALARRLLPRLKLPLRIRVVPTPDANAYPEAPRQRDFAAQDAARIAPCHDLPAPVAIPEAQRAATTARLCAADTAEAFLRIERECLAAIANGDTLTTDADASRKGAAVLAANAARRRKLGHYLPAMWQYGGEWFWALDRLEFLHARLHADDALQGAEPLSILDPSRLPVPAAAPDPPDRKSTRLN